MYPKQDQHLFGFKPSLNLISNELNEHKRLLDIKAQLIDKKLTDSNIKRILGMEIPDKNKIIYIDLVK